jgi:hypothetical protein
MIENYKNQTIEIVGKYNYGIPVVLDITVNDFVQSTKLIAQSTLFNQNKILDDRYYHYCDHKNDFEKHPTVNRISQEHYEYKNAMLDGIQTISIENKIVVKAEFKRGYPHGKIQVRDKIVYFSYGITISKDEYDKNQEITNLCKVLFDNYFPKDLVNKFIEFLF